MTISWYDQWESRREKGAPRQRLPPNRRQWRRKEVGPWHRPTTPEEAERRLAGLRSRFSIGDDGYLVDRGSGHGPGSVPCALWLKV